MKGKMRTLALALTLIFAVALVCVLALFAGASETVQTTGAMVDIEANLSEYRLGGIQYVADDGYIGIPVQISVYHDSNKTVTAGVGGTPLIIYVINTNTQRIGTDSDTSIITSMLDRGYLVTVVDYLKNTKAANQGLDWSIQGLRAKIEAGTYFSGMGIPSSNYRETFVVPAGYDVSLDNIYWEIDKHSSAGTLEYIVEVWNEDFRSVFAERVIKWVDSDGNRKSTQNGYDGTSVVWLNADGTENADGEYIKAKHTLATDIEDCVKADGSALDLNLYMSIIYPTNPESAVPVMALAASGDHLASVAGTADRPQLNGFVFSGYAGVIYDYGYTPMAREDHYNEFSGSGSTGVTGDNVTYSISFYNDKKINTAAMRYLRYLAASDETFAFDTEAIGVYGNSKGGWMTYLGEEHPELLTEKRFFVGHHGESRYEAGETEASASGLIDGGEEQPWLTYGGVAIDSGADLIYASCGGGEEHITDGHAPTFVSSHTGDGTYFGMQNHIINNCRNHNVPCVWFEVNLGHTFTYGKDMNYGCDTYDALFTFCDYYLKGEAVEVLYTAPAADAVDVAVTSSILVKFSGAVPEAQILTASVTDSDGNALVGEWTSLYGDTEWTFAPTGALTGGESYTLTIPATTKGDNGLAMGEAHSYSFTTVEEHSSGMLVTSGTLGTYYTMTLDDSSTGAAKYTLRFAVSNSDAHNLAQVYPVTSYNSASPDSSVIASEPIAEVGIDGAGVYECDVTDYLAALERGDIAAFLIKAGRTEGTSPVASLTLDSSGTVTHGNITAEYSSEIAGTEGTAALKVTGFNLTTITGSKETVVYYNNNTTVLRSSNLIKDGALSMSDMGRTFNISFRVYDTVSRRLQVYFNSATSSTYGTADYNAIRYNLTTKEGEWVEYSFDYTVYEPVFGSAGQNYKNLYIDAQTFGDISGDYPLYIDSIESYETVTAMTLGESASLIYKEQYVDPLETPYGRIGDTYADAEAFPVAVFVKSGNSWVFKTASATLPTSFNYGADAVVYFRGNYSLSSSKYSLDSIGAGNSLTFDLNGYTLDITGAGQYNALTSNATANNVTFNMMNGRVYSNGKASLVCIYGNTSNTVNLNFKDLDITFGESFGETSTLIRHGYHEGATMSSTYNIAFTDCNVDISACNSSSIYAIRAGYGSSGGYALNWTVNGGSLNAGSSSFYSNNVCIQNGGRLRFGKGADGEYFKLILTADVSITTAFTDTDEKNRYFGAIETDGTNYTHTLLNLSTEYGNISVSRASALKYPFIAFYEGVEKTWGDFFGANNMEYSLRSVDGAVVVMRRDFALASGGKYGNLSHHQGKITLDLNGYTLSGEGGSSTGIISATGMNTYTTHFLMKNGTVEINTPLLAISTYSTGADKTQIFTFENLDVISTGSKLIHYNSPIHANTVQINFNSCDLDFSEATSMPSLFIAGNEDNGYFTTTLTVNGGSVKINAFNDGKLASAYTGSSISFTESSSNEFKLYLPSGTASPTGVYNTSLGDRVLMKQSTQDGYDVYTLSEVRTKYGAFPTAYLSASTYPLLVYVKSGDEWVFDSAYTALPHSFTYGADAVMLVRGDIALDSSIYDLDTITSGSAFVIDLDGNTLILTDGGQYWTFRTKFLTPLDFTIKDGKLVNGGVANLISMASAGSAEQNITLDNIDLSLIGTGTADGYLITRYNAGSTTNTGKLNLTVKNCDIDTTASTAALRIFQAGRYDGMFNVNYTVTGGTVKTASYHDKMIYSESGSTVTFIPGSDGKNTLISLPVGSAVSQITYYDGDGKSIYMVEQSTDGTYDLYMPESLETPYGSISYSVSSKVDYPFLAFTDNGDGTYTYLTANSNFFKSGDMEYTLRSETCSVVLMRRDFSAESYQCNISNNPNSIVFDLGGNTLTMAHKAGAFNLIAKHSTTTSLTIKNGTVLLDDYHFITFESNEAGAGKVFNITLEDVTFDYAEGATVTSPYKFNSVAGAFELNLALTDCVFDADENCPAGDLIPAASIEGINFDVKVSGGNITADSFESLNISNALSNIIFTRNENNEYMTVTLPLGVSAPASVFTTDLGSMTLVKLATAENNAVYYLRDTSRFITPSGSLTLYSDFVYNVYVPVKDSLISITIDGTKYEDLAALEKMVIGSAEYYHLTKRISVSKACDEFTLALEIEVFEGRSQTASWNLGIISYVNKLLSGNYTDTVKTLGKDILSYIRAAYAYGDSSAEEIAELDTIIGENYDVTSVPNTNVEGAFNVPGLSSATLELGDAPAFRFYIDGSYDASLYKFEVNGNAVESLVITDQSGRTYIRVSMYAYAMTDTVTYTIDGTEVSGEYNLKTYYDFTLTLDDALLSSLVERLWKYSESASAYKAEVTA